MAVKAVSSAGKGGGRRKNEKRERGMLLVWPSSSFRCCPLPPLNARSSECGRCGENSVAHARVSGEGAGAGESGKRRGKGPWLAPSGLSLRSLSLSSLSLSLSLSFLLSCTTVSTCIFLSFYNLSLSLSLLLFEGDGLQARLLVTTKPLPPMVVAPPPPPLFILSLSFSRLLLPVCETGAPPGLYGRKVAAEDTTLAVPLCICSLSCV